MLDRFRDDEADVGGAFAGVVLAVVIAYIVSNMASPDTAMIVGITLAATLGLIGAVNG